MTKRKLLMAAAAALAVVVVGLHVTGGPGYQVKLVMPSAAMLSKRTPVWINGQKAGEVTSLAVQNGMAVATVSINGSWGPLHTGTSSRVDWVSVVGERVLTLYPGPKSNPVIPDGSMFQGPSAQIEVDQLLATLDAPTRAHLTLLLGGLNQTVAGHEDQLRQAIVTASGTVRGLGEIMQAVGSDGPAIHALVSQLSQMTTVAAQRQDKIAHTVANLNTVTSAVAAQQTQLTSTLQELPSTLAAARTTLGKVPGAVDATVGLLNALQPATSKLPAISADLAPTLVDLRPAIGDLRPLMTAAQTLLGETPRLLDTSHQVVPSASVLLNGIEPAISFLRPYTPEAVGGLDNWGQAFAPYDGAGHTWAGLLAPGVNAFNESPVPLPSTRLDPTPAPGSVVGQPWTDATGSGIR
ncbi:MAG: Mammalian cell entry related domain protein [Marmoricola sp.]|nr:Mammalian cell entry related domain protein [Marmoricola sp.]